MTAEAALPECGQAFQTGHRCLMLLIPMMHLETGPAGRKPCMEIMAHIKRQSLRLTAMTA